MDKKRILTLYGLFLLASSFISSTFATTYQMPQAGDDVVGKIFTISARAHDTLKSIGDRYDISHYEMLEANQNIHNPRSLAMGQKVVIPAQFILPTTRKGIVINLSELRLYYFTPDGQEVMTYPVGVGRRDWRTPIISSHVISKAIDPDWHVPKEIQQYTYTKYNRMLPDMIKGGDPENPLGQYAIYLAKPGILIHGTNQQESVGNYVSSGCIRLHAQDIEELYNNVKHGTPVQIMNVSQKAGWLNNQLYLESQIPLRLAAGISAYNHDSALSVVERMKSKYQDVHINWQKVKQIGITRAGIPEVVGYRAES